MVDQSAISYGYTRFDMGFCQMPLDSTLQTSVLLLTHRRLSRTRTTSGIASSTLIGGVTSYRHRQLPLPEPSSRKHRRTDRRIVQLMTM